ncbi:HPF/RaiA family ribosome-associated protein [Gloeothece verrucosa]|uniref:Cold-shock protein DNA-binding protein n=1 Tax=Gloeothece verrucosa (strain PCC 7822) TaxID=497965 RepID=E0UGS4_GLOV7|nr:HPF/RaiA family ribosome-associated protein [Gloeothece verrucosa]ADN14405.1 Cold-shock protein DNA-binding protein [Gloeothece verrucosa PCC 7822]
MKIPVEISYRGVEKTDTIETLIDEKVAKLEKFCNYLNSCHIAVEKIHDRPRSGSPYRVRIDITVPPSHELVAESNPAEQNQYVELDRVIRDAFSKAERQVKELSRQQRDSDQAKSGAAQDTEALVVRLFPEQDYGFLKTLDGEEIYFHRNSVLHNDFERLAVGTGVRYSAIEDDQGPRATTVQIVDKPGANVGKSDINLVEPPLGWE